MVYSITYALALAEIIDAVERVKLLPKRLAVELLDGFNDEEYENIFDFSTDHATATLVYDEHGCFERIGMDIYIYEDGEEVDIVNTFEELKILARAQEEAK